MTKELLPHHFSQTRICVIGDVMLDTYFYGNTSRISPEAPVPVVQIKRREERPGGAANVALNITALGGQAVLLGMCGEDAEAIVLKRKLEEKNVECCLQVVPNLPTIVKTRVLSLQQQLIRLDIEANFSAVDKRSLYQAYLRNLADVQVVVLSDYAKGTLTDTVSLITAARECNIFVLVDPKHLDFSHYRGASLVTPNRKEFEAVVGICHDDIEITLKAQQLIAEHALGALLITRGAEGMTLVQPNVSTIHIPVQSQEVYDVTGAGDTVIAVIAAALAAGNSLVDATQWANIAAGLVIRKIGAATVTTVELQRACHEYFAQDLAGIEMGVIDEARLIHAVQTAKRAGRRIVMTNGCFDILHRGHVAYLEQAKALGDFLILAMNDDDSVRRLKGETRPINALSERMAVIAGLAAVDWVVPFSEDTPARLIEKISPDVLVKGGDYQVEQIAGAQHVLAYGGEVKILPFVQGCSTTNIVEKMKEERFLPY